MKKIGIVTICDNCNYGNRLQNYAVQEMLKEMGFSPTTLKNVNYQEYRYTYDPFFVKKILARVLYTPVKKKMHEESIRNWQSQFEKEEKRYANFQRFNKLIHFSKEWLTEYNLDIDAEEYSAFVTGSDQVFNYRYGRANRIDFLSFAGKIPRIALSASIGLEKIPKKYHRRYRKYLQKFSAVSVREETAKTELDKILNDNVSVTQVVDPTMTLEAEQWKKLAENSNVHLPEKYIVVMYLGQCEPQIEADIHGYAMEQNCEIVRLNDKREGAYYGCGPFEFLKIIRDARMVFTDSFHTCVFSILFHKNFYATKRKGDDEQIFSRIFCLLEQFGFSDRVFMGGNCEAIEEEVFEEAEHVLQRERIKIKKFMRQCLDSTTQEV